MCNSNKYSTLDEAVEAAKELIKANHDPANGNWLQIIESNHPEQSGFWLETTETLQMIRWWERQVWTYSDKEGERFLLVGDGDE